MDDGFLGVHRGVQPLGLLYIGSKKNVTNLKRGRWPSESIQVRKLLNLASKKNVTYVKRGRWLSGRTPWRTGAWTVVYRV